MTTQASSSDRGTAAPRPRLAARIVSLASSDDRRRAVATNLAELGFAWAFCDALTAESAAPIAESRERQMARFGRPLAPGEIGVFKSQLAALAAFDQDPLLDWLLVLEDDVWIDPGFPFRKTIALLERFDIHYLRLFARRFKNADVLAQLGVRQLVRFRTDPHGAQAYLIDRAGAARIRRNIRSIDMPIDDEIARFWEHGLDIYAIFPFPAVERTTVSTIQPSRGTILTLAPRPSWRRRLNRIRDFAAKAAANLRFRLILRRRWHGVRWRDLENVSGEGC